MQPILILPVDWLFETIKLIVQLGGAVAVALLTVRWALVRYKREKSWERKLAAHADIIAALGAMLPVVIAQIAEKENLTVYGPNDPESNATRYRDAQTKLVESYAQALLLLRQETCLEFHRLLAALDRSSKLGDVLTSLKEEHRLLSLAMTRFSSIARNELQLE